MRNETFTPDGQLIERYDSDTGLYTQYVDGAKIESRPLTTDEAAWLNPPVVLTPEQKIEAAATALAALDGITAPVLPIDVLEILTDVRTALEG